MVWLRRYLRSLLGLDSLFSYDRSIHAVKRYIYKEVNTIIGYNNYYTSNIGAPKYIKGEIHSHTTSWYDEWLFTWNLQIWGIMRLGLKPPVLAGHLWFHSSRGEGHLYSLTWVGTPGSSLVFAGVGVCWGHLFSAVFGSSRVVIF